MNQQPQIQIYKKERKFHDPIFFILFLIFSSTFGGYVIWKGYSPLKEVLVTWPPISIMAGMILCLLLTLLLMTFCFIAIPEIILNASFFISPAIFLFYSFQSGNPIGIFFTLVSVGITLMLYFFVYRHRIRYSAATLKTTTGILIPHLPMLVAIASILAIMNIALFLLTAGIFKTNEYRDIVIIAYSLFLYWNFFSIMYGYRVLCSSIVALEIFGSATTGVSFILLNSIRNTLFCLGSITFAALLIAIVQTLKYLVNRNQRDQRDQGIFMIILIIILNIILDMIGDILNFVNEWVFVYMALYGQSYLKSMKNAYDELMNGNNQILLNSLAMQPLLSLMGFGGIFVFIDVYLRLLGVTLEKLGKEELLPIILLVFFYIYLVQLFIVIFDSGSKSLLFAFNKDSKAIRDKYPETYEILREVKNKS